MIYDDRTGKAVDRWARRFCRTARLPVMPHIEVIGTQNGEWEGHNTLLVTFSPRTRRACRRFNGLVAGSAQRLKRLLIAASYKGLDEILVQADLDECQASTAGYRHRARYRAKEYQPVPTSMKPQSGGNRQSGDAGSQ
jgi:hypothetical protein